jgi:hypothetical protein
VSHGGHRHPHQNTEGLMMSGPVTRVPNQPNDGTKDCGSSTPWAPEAHTKGSGPNDKGK